MHLRTQSITARRRGGRILLALLVATAGLAATAPAAHATDPLPDDNLIEPRNMGGGASMGTWNYTGTPLPQVGALCARNLTFTLGNNDTGATGGWQSEAFVFNTVISGFAGPVKMTGGGHSNTSCESYSLGGGKLTIELFGYNEITEAKLDCNDEIGDVTKSSPLTGQYTRVLSDLTVVLTGRCLVNEFATGLVTFVARIQATPADLQNLEGLTSPVQKMNTTGSFALVPS